MWKKCEDIHINKNRGRFLKIQEVERPKNWLTAHRNIRI